MSIEKVKNTTFPPISIEKWQETVEKTLAGKEIHSLNNQSYEGIQLSPLYTKKDTESLEIEQQLGKGTYIQGSASNGWRISQRISSHHWTDMKKNLETALENGQDTIALNLDELLNIENVNFKEIKKIDQIPIVIMTTSHHQVITNKLMEIDKNIAGIFGTDLISSYLSEGFIIEPDNKIWVEWEENITRLNTHPDLKTILINITPYHMSGAVVVQELAIAIAEAVFYIEFLKQKGWEPNKIAEKITFHFSIGSHFFMEVAKLRSFRVLWHTIASAYDIKNTAVTISAETSEFTKTILDPYVNILRASNEAFAAILGGIDYIHITPFDAIISESTDFSERIARNIQLILKEEAYFNKVTDTAGGSYFIEKLTSELVLQAWKLFQEIDKRGGIFKVLETGWLQEEIQQKLQQKIKDVQSGNRSIIGVNVYRQSDEKHAKPKQSKEKKMKIGTKIKPLTKTRLAETIESELFNQRMRGMEHGD